MECARWCRGRIVPQLIKSPSERETMGRAKIREMTPNGLSLLIVTILLLMIAAFWISYGFLPVPPRTLVMTTGMEGGTFAYFGERYQQLSSRDGVKVRLLPSSGSVENMRRLTGEPPRADVGFVQGGAAETDQTSNLVSLGGVFYTPLWIFYRNDETLNHLSALEGQRISIGPEGSGVRKFSLDLLKAAGISGPPTELFELPSQEAGKAILEKRVDAVMIFGLADSQVVKELIAAPGIKLMNLAESEAFTRIFPQLFHVVLPKGIFNPATMSPASDINLVAPITHLVVRKDLHPALIYLLLKSSSQIHSGAGWVHRAGDFPSINTQDFPVTEQAKRYYRSGGSALYDFLPFWAAAIVEHLLLIIIPFGIILIPLLGFMPWVYTYRNRSKFYLHYRELMNLDRELSAMDAPAHFDRLHERLDKIEEAVGVIRISVVFYDEVFILKEHMKMLREKLFQLERSSVVKSDIDG